MLLCNFCSESPKVATIACENCSYYYCSACAKRFHPKVGPLKSHNLINASALSHEERSCLLHEGFKFTVYCMSCMQLLCLRCVPDHASHTLDDIEQAFNKSVDHLKDLSNQLNEHLTRSNKVKQETEEHIHRLEKEGRAAEKKIRMEAEFLRNTVSGGEKNMIQTVQQELREKISSLQEALEEIPRLSTGSMSVLNDLSGILQKSSFMHVLSKFGELNSRAQSQLDLLDSVERPSDVQIGFDYENFQCADLVNVIADKLSIQSSNPHALMFSATSAGGLDNFHTLHMAYKPDISPPQRDVITGGAEIPQSPSDNRLFTKLTAPTFLTRTVSKHPEFLRQTVSVGDTLNNRRDLPEQCHVRQPTEDDIFNKHTEKDSAGGEHFQITEESPITAAKQSRIRKLEEIWRRKMSEQRDTDSTTSERTNPSLRLLSAEDSVSPTTTGAAQRAKQGYYSAYQLTSDRSYKEEVPATEEKS